MARWTRLVSASLAALAAAPQAQALNDLPRQVALSGVNNVEWIIRQAVSESWDRGAASTIAVVDRVGNVLAVYEMAGASPTVVVDPNREVRRGAPEGDGLNGFVGDIAAAAAISKAITGAYLSSNGNAFSTRTASNIIQENFLPLSRHLEGGPLFGVQFSSLPCSDLVARFASNNGGTINARIGPKRSPLGLAGDPGGFPLYLDGALVGGIGVVADGNYRVDRDIRDRDGDLDEIIAVAGTAYYEAPSEIRADRITVDGRTLRYSDVGVGDLRSDPANSARVDLRTAGRFISVRGYYAGGRALSGQAFGFAGSGIVRDTSGRFGTDRAFILADASGRNRFTPRNGTGAQGLRANEVTQILSSALGVALSARAQIRRPLDSNVEVTISVVDTNGTILGVVRAPDAPVFGTDVSLQKARSAMFFSNSQAATDLGRAGQSRYVSAMRSFVSENALSGAIGYSNRSIGNLARPFYPDGQNGRHNGPLSKPFEVWSPFNTGLQLDLVLTANIVPHVLFILTGTRDTAARCANLPRLANGLQIFPGGVPIYRNGTLVGGVGVSGDGIDQDDMVAFLGLSRAGDVLGTGIGNAPDNIRSDRLDPDNVNLRYVQCPYKPFFNSDRQNVCDGN